MWKIISLTLILLIITKMSSDVLIYDVLNGTINLLRQYMKQFSEEPSDTIFVNEEYDFIVVGAGTAGCAVAARLAENPQWNILLIEAGGSENFYADIPAAAGYLLFTSMNWGYKVASSPDGKYCGSAKNGQCSYGVGRVVGGSSTINFQVYTRGHRDNFDEWARLGNKGWSYDDVLPYFRKVETFNNPGDVNMSYHGDSGPVHVGYSSELSKLGQITIEASKQFGLKYVDYNGQQQIGVSRVQSNIHKGIRESSSRSYLHPIRYKENFHLKKWSQVKRVLINPKTKEAFGVEYVNAGQTYQVKARKEVILSGGAVNSPKILLLSGIGPKDHLNDVNIEVIQDLPVGQSAVDHILAKPVVFTVEKNLGLHININEMLQFANNFTGPFTTPVLFETLVFTNVNNPNNRTMSPDIELVFSGVGIQRTFSVLNSVGMLQEAFDELYGEIMHNDTITVYVLLLQPKSHGQVLLRDNKYDTPPIIAPNYLDVDEDLDTLVKGIETVIKIVNQDAFKVLKPKLWEKKLKKCEQYPLKSKEYLKCSIRQVSFSLFHMVNTCRMGPDSDKLAVVDQRLRVKGVKNLRVIDSSIMPHIPAAHTNAPTFMVAEKGADLIKEDYR